MIVLTILTLVLVGNSNAFLFLLHFVGLKGQYTSKLLFGLENRLKIKVSKCIKKITKMRINEISNNEKKSGFSAFLG